jgi:hypothetical protein
MKIHLKNRGAAMNMQRYCIIAMLFLFGCAGPEKFERNSDENTVGNSVYRERLDNESSVYNESAAPYSKSKTLYDKYEKADIKGYLDETKQLKRRTGSPVLEQEKQLSQLESMQRETDKSPAPPQSRSAPGPEQPVGEPPRKPDRMVHYDGNIKQRATNPEAVLDSAIRHVRSLGGDLQARDMESATLRVPVEKFQAAFQTLLLYAEVLEKSISARDITESYKDNELRLKIAESTIERLKAILAKTEKDADKIAILNEIKRLSETVEALSLERQAIKDRSDFSTIRLEVIPHHPGSDRYAQTELEGFYWIKKLSPFNNESRYGEGYLAFAVPKEMVAVKRKHGGVGGLWRASSADGAEFWGCRRNNRPDGNTDFWFASLRERLKDEFASVDSAAAGNFRLLRMTSYDPDPYIYLVGVRANGGKIEVAEAYFPSAKQEDRYKKEILAAISAGAL